MPAERPAIGCGDVGIGAAGCCAGWGWVGGCGADGAMPPAGAKPPPGGTGAVAGPPLADAWSTVSPNWICSLPARVTPVCVIRWPLTNVPLLEPWS